MIREKHQDGRQKPEWATRAKHIDSKPEWVELPPRELWDLGKVFFPIEPGTKIIDYPHSYEENRYRPDSEILNAHIEAGWNYCISCAGDLAVVDVDDKRKIDDVTDVFPETLWQVSGSRKGIHLFYKVPGRNSGGTLYDQWLGRNIEIGDVKAHENELVIGPGSKHPSGNRYGPVHGEKIAEMTKEEFEECLSHFEKEIPDEEKQTGFRTNVEREGGGGRTEQSELHPFYQLEPKDITPWLTPGKRVPHPVHGSSSTGANFMLNENLQTFTCWRHDYGRGPGCGLNAQQLLAVKASQRQCDAVRRLWDSNPSLHYKAFMQAIQDGHIPLSRPPYTVVCGYAYEHDLISHEMDMHRGMYIECENRIMLDLTLPKTPDTPGDI